MFKLQFDKFISLTYFFEILMVTIHNYDIFINLMLIIVIISILIKSKIIIMLIKTQKD